MWRFPLLPKNNFQMRWYEHVENVMYLSAHPRTTCHKHFPCKMVFASICKILSLEESQACFQVLSYISCWAAAIHTDRSPNFTHCLRPSSKTVRTGSGNVDWFKKGPFIPPHFVDFIMISLYPPNFHKLLYVNMYTSELASIYTYSISTLEILAEDVDHDSLSLRIIEVEVSKTVHLRFNSGTI